MATATYEDKTDDPDLFRKYRPRLYYDNPPDTEKALRAMADLARIACDAVRPTDGNTVRQEAARDFHALYSFALAAVTEHKAETAALLAAARREAAEAFRAAVINRIRFRAEKWQQGDYGQRSAAADLLADDIAHLEVT